jgi:DNA-binding MarR family transcriptional regulator
MIDLDAAAKKVQAECLCTRARQAARLLSRVYDDWMRPTGLHGSQFTVLIGAARFGEAGATIGKLAGKLVMDRTTLTRNIGPLEKEGFIRVARSPHDARVKVVLLTRKGERAIETGMPLWEQAQEAVRNRMGAARAGRLGVELEAVRTSFDDDDDDDDA